MFQTFDVSSDPTQGPPRLRALRAEMATEGLDASIVPRHDRFQGEYVAPCDARLGWLTGFTGSAGFCIVTRDVAGVFVDGRYRVQVRREVADVFTPVDWPEVHPADWLGEHVTRGAVIGYDPWLHSVTAIAELTAQVERHGLVLRPAGDLVGRLWTDRPAPPGVPFFAQPDDLAGETHADKRARLAAPLAEAGTAAAVLTLPDSIAWLLNIRGGDTARNPVPQAYALLRADASVTLFALPGQADAVADHLGPDVTVLDAAAFEAVLTTLGGPVQIDPATAPQAVKAILEAAGGATLEAPDPCILPKARKNATELDGARAAHLRDGAAMVRFLAWLDAEAPTGRLTEISVVKALEGFRRDTNALRDISFETISGAGPDGAVIHYRVSEATDRQVNLGELLLVDSGGQYADGTTDITRTITVGNPPGGRRRVLYRRAARPDRDPPRAVPQGGGGARPRRAGATVPLGAGPRLRPWDRPRRRRLSERPRRAAGHRAAQHGGPRTGHDPVERAGILPRGGLWHPHREPDRRARGACPARRRRAQDDGFRDADLRALRPPPDPRGRSGARRKGLDRPLSRGYARPDRAPGGRRGGRMAPCRLRAPLTSRPRQIRPAASPKRAGRGQGEPRMASHITIRPATGTWVVRAAGAVIAETTDALELVEGGGAPVIYIPRADIAMAFLEPSDTRTTCPHKGEASYYSVISSAEAVKDAAWSYETPHEAVAQIAGHLAFYTDKVAVEEL